VVGHDGVHHGGGLVVQHALRLGGQRAGDGHGSLVAGGKVRRVGVAGTGDIHHRQQAVDYVLFVLGVVILAQLQGEQDVSATVSESNRAPD